MFLFKLNLSLFNLTPTPNLLSIVKSELHPSVQIVDVLIRNHMEMIEQFLRINKTLSLEKQKGTYHYTSLEETKRVSLNFKKKFSRV